MKRKTGSHPTTEIFLTEPARLGIYNSFFRESQANLCMTASFWQNKGHLSNRSHITAASSSYIPQSARPSHYSVRKEPITESPLADRSNDSWTWAAGSCMMSWCEFGQHVKPSRLRWDKETNCASPPQAQSTNGKG
ncbi:predicted protein [Histoplasma mississippiense (nom. inval.)]|uniref:predicted protein n=1 Tax=Ajellomyces capsulatus (strain NAm1 / WU24) TaxID=2059318 RepID=UPI000157B897|nr:predicted protein [Histoplasma mississippiense (nom. inval.)]EDN03965.1 predicted protein [Histoplasma mississippiense (nom. inval.)]